MSNPIIEAPPDKLRRLRDLRQQVREARRQNADWRTPGGVAAFCEPTTLQTPALDLIDAAASAVIFGDVTRQQIYAPPQTGKSQRISRWTPLCALIADPTLRIAIISAESELARRWGRTIRRDLRANPELGLLLREDSQAAGRWETIEGGELFCAGYATGTTGRPIDLLIIDDPFKNRADAESSVIRERVWEFWENDAATRARRVILMHTRWHEDDLAGRLLVREPGQWQVLSIPAIAERADDPLGRVPGDEIQSANPKLHPPGYYQAMQQTASPYVWSSLYQQHPAPAEGGLLKRTEAKSWTWTDDSHKVLNLGGRTMPVARLWKFVTADLATSLKTSADFTAAGVWGVSPDGELILLDGLRERLEPAQHWPKIDRLRTKWDVSRVYIEAAMNATTLAHEAGRAGIPISELKPESDKWSRAQPAAARLNQGRVWVPSERDAPWVGSWLDEWVAFPNGSHDDTVDVLAYAAIIAATRSGSASMASPADALAGLSVGRIPMRLPR